MGTNIKISKRLVAINAVGGVTAKILNVGVLIWLQPYLLGRISADEYSLYPVLASLIIFLPLITTVFTSGLSRFAVEAATNGDDQRITQITSTFFSLLLGAGSFLLIAGWLLAWQIDHVLTIAPEQLADAQLMFALLVTAFVARAVLTPFFVGFEIRQKFVQLNAISLGVQVVRVSILFILLFGVSTRVLWVVVAATGADFCGALVTMVISRRLVPALRFRVAEIRRDLIGRIASFGGWVSLAQLADMMRLGAAPIVLNKLGTSVDVTVFYLGSLAFRQLQDFSSAVRRPLLTPLTALHTSGNIESVKNIYLRGGKYSLWASLLLVAPLVIFRQEVMLLYVGNTYLTAASVMALLLLTFPLTYGNVMMPQLAYAKGEMRGPALGAFFTQVINLGLTMYLVGPRQMGAVGAALSLVIVVGISQPLVFWPMGLRLARVDFGRWARETLRPGFGPCLAGLIAWVSWPWVLDESRLPMLLLCIAGGTSFYLAGLFGFCLDDYDRDHLRRLWMGVRSWGNESWQTVKEFGREYEHDL